MQRICDCGVHDETMYHAEDGLENVGCGVEVPPVDD